LILGLVDNISANQVGLRSRQLVVRAKDSTAAT